MEQIKHALQYALKLLKDQADKGRYPDLALQENGGNGFQPITNAIDLIKIDNQPIQFNINHSVKVKVTEYGYEVWLAHENKFVHLSGTIKPVTIEELKAKQDEDGYTKFQLWDMMSIFGHKMQMGFKNPIHPHIILLPEN